MPRSVDHLVVAVPDLAAAQDLYRAIGFTVGSRNLHPWGTENAVVALDGAYLELIGLAEGHRPPPPENPAAPFAVPVAAAAARGGGLALVALSSEDADADAARFHAAGLGQGRRLDFARDARAPDGAVRVLRFGLAFSDLPGLSEAGVFACRHHQSFGDAAGRRHANGASRLDTVVLAADAPAALARPLSLLLETPADGSAERPGFATPTARLSVMRPAEAEARYGAGAVPGRVAGFGVMVEALAPVRALLDRAGLAHREIAGAVVVPPAAAFGVALAITLPPCHSLARSGGAAA